MEIVDILKNLSDAVCAGEINEAERLAANYLGEYCEIRKARDGSVYGFMDFGRDKTLLLDAHIDEIAMTVISVSENGFLKVAKMGGIDPRILPAQRVKIWGKELVKGVFTSVPPHLRSGDSQLSFDNLYIDTCLGKKAVDIIPVGSVVTFDVESRELAGGLFTGKSLDNRASVAVLIRTAEILSYNDLSEYNICFLLSREEELGLRGARTAAFDIKPDECIVVDVTFGNLPGIPSHKTGNLGDGPMIGISPIIPKEVSDGLNIAASFCECFIQYEIMGGSTSTNADVISISRSGVKTGLISIPLRNMHTPSEIISLADIESTARILAEYTLGGKLYD